MYASPLNGELLYEKALVVKELLSQNSVLTRKIRLNLKFSKNVFSI